MHVGVSAVSRVVHHVGLRGSVGRVFERCRVPSSFAEISVYEDVRHMLQRNTRGSDKHFSMEPHRGYHVVRRRLSFLVQFTRRSSWDRKIGDTRLGGSVTTVYRFSRGGGKKTIRIGLRRVNHKS